MLRRLLVVLVLLSLLVPVGFADELFPVSDNLTSVSVNVDASEDAVDFSEVPVMYSITDLDGGQEISTRDFTSENGRVEIGLEPGLYQVEIGVDFEGTQGFDYYGESLLTVREETVGLTLGVQKVGSFSVGLVDRNGVPVEDGDLSVECEGSYGVQGSQEVDEFGTAQLDFLPVGSCTFRGSVGGFFVSYDTVIEHGSRENVTLRFDEYSVEQNGFPWIYVILGLFIVLIVASVWFSDVRFEFVDNGHDDKEDGLSDKQQGILLGVGGRERKVLQCLFDVEVEGEDGLSQAELSRRTGIPKTSLARIVDKLEGRDLIDVDKEGRLKKIRISNFFLKK